MATRGRVCPFDLIPKKTAEAIAEARFVKFSATDLAEQGDTEGEIVMGVAYTPALQGDVLDVACRGFPVVEVGGTALTIPPGTPVMTDTDGKAIVATDGNFAAGYSLEQGKTGATMLIHMSPQHYETT